MRKRRPFQTARGLRSGMLDVVQTYFAAPPGASRTIPRHFKPHLELLEDRHMMSVTPAVVVLSGTAESVIAISGDTADEGTSVAVSIDDALVGTVAIDSTGDGTLN